MIPAWPNYRDYHQFMRFGIGKSPDIVVQADFLCDRMEFWEKLLTNVSTIYDMIIDNSPNDTFSNNDDTIDSKLAIYLLLLIVALLCIYY